MKYFILGIVVAFVLYWATTGILRRLFRPPRRARSAREPEERSRERPAPPALDYSKVRDADYRDVKKEPQPRRGQER